MAANILETVALAGAAHDPMIAAMELAYPFEGCGILVGEVENGRVRVDGFVAAGNQAAHQGKRYEINGLAFLRAEKMAEAVGQRVVGFAHSHPDAAAIPSEMDRQAAWEGYLYVIVSVVRGKAGHVRAWVLDEKLAFREVALS